MSLGSRIYYSRTLATIQPAGIPREPLYFLYPRYFTFSALQASQPTSALAEAPAEDSQPRNPASASFSTRRTYRHLQNARLNGILVKSTGWAAHEKQPPYTIFRPLPEFSNRSDQKTASIEESDMSKVQLSKDQTVSGDLPLEKDLETPTFSHLQERFRGQATNVRRVKSRVQWKATNVGRVKSRVQWKIKHLEDKAVANSQLKDKGIWSYDWRIPLQELEKCSVHQDSGAEVSTVSPPTIRRLLGKKYNYRQVQVKDISYPQVWSTTTFAAYVEDLTLSTVSRHMNRYLYTEGQSHVTNVERTLKALFANPWVSRYQTVESFNVALVFFYKYNMIPSARMFLTLMEERHMNIPPETFNIMLRGASTRKDLYNFTFLLRAMIRRGITPTADTWIALIVAVQSKAAKLRIVHSMREQGFLDHQRAIKDLLSHLVPTEIISYVESGQDIPSLFQNLDRKYELQWLSVSTGNQMCQKLGEHGFMFEAFEILDLMVDRDCLPDKVTMMIFLGHFQRQRDVGGAIQMLDWFHNVYGLSLEEKVLDTLFMLAWRSRLYNCCRVIWRTACIYGTVSYRMQQLVMKSLIRNTPEQPQTWTQRWMKSIGKVVIGINIRTAQHADDPGTSLTVMKKLVHWAEPGDQRAASLQLAKFALAQDLEAAQQFDLNGNFTDLLNSALDLDREWGLGDTWSAKCTLWKVENAIHIDLIKRDQNHPHSRGRASY